MKINSRWGCSTEVYRAGFRSVREAVEAVSFVTDEHLGRMKRVLATEVDARSEPEPPSLLGAPFVEAAACCTQSQRCEPDRCQKWFLL